MSIAFKKYMMVLILLLLTGVTNLYANNKNISESFFTANTENSSQFSAETNNNLSVFSGTQENDDYTLFFEGVEIEEAEDEKPSSKEFISLFTHVANAFRIQLLNDLSLELQKDIFRHKNDFTRSSERLHIKFQVFII